MKTLADPKQSLMDRAGGLLDLARNTDFVIPDDTGYFSIEDDLVRQVRALVRQTADLMRDVMDCYDTEAAGHQVPDEISGAGDEGFLREIGAQISAQMAVEEVSGLAFVSRGQLLDTLGAIDQAVASREIWKVASHVDAGLRHAGRALVAIESAIRECEGLPAVFRPWQNLDDSLEVRRIYGEFRRAVLRGGDDRELGDDELRAGLDTAARQIAELRRREIYPYLRIDDRLQIRRLQKRIQGWIEGDGDAEAGARLWSDLLGFARLLYQVNHRQEVREHDRLAVNGLYQRFFERGRVPERLTADHMSWLEPLLGRDDELDHVLLDPESHQGADLRAPLERLRRELGRPFERSVHTDFLNSAHG